MDDRTQRAAASRRATMKILLYVHIAVYVAVNALLIGINLATTEYQWFWWPLLGWGVLLAIHAAAAPLMGWLSSTRRKMIDKEMDQHRS